MKQSIEYAFNLISEKDIKKDLPSKTKYTKAQCYEILIENLTKLANSDEFLFENMKGI